MNIAIVHYHLEKGGVTRVIENTLSSFSKLPDSPKFVVLSGREYKGKRIKNVKVVEGLDYCSCNNSISASDLKQKMENAAIEAFSQKPDLWHIHNHSLGKNPGLTKACHLIASSSYPILLHIHDFAEDGRPSNFHSLKEVYDKTYPTSPNIHYAVLNQRDFSFIQNLLQGSPSKAHLLANALPSKTKNKQSKIKSSNLPENLFLYPVRAVRRKNLGELVLLASTYDDLSFANSLGPTNSNFISTFNRWKEFCKNLNIPVSFGIGENLEYSFEEIMNSVSGIVTTSIAEGFGLGFLEPWTFNKFLNGRNIPDITEDFSKLGVKLDHMYSRVEIDFDHIKNKTLLRPKIEHVMTKFFSDYGIKPPNDGVDRAFNDIVKNNRIDFGRIDEPLQEEIILSVSKSENAKNDIKEQTKIGYSNSQLIAENALAIEKSFALDSYRDRLQKIYRLLCSSESRSIEFANGNNLLQSFLTPERINLLRTT